MAKFFVCFALFAFIALAFSADEETKEGKDENLDTAAQGLALGYLGRPAYPGNYHGVVYGGHGYGHAVPSYLNQYNGLNGYNRGYYGGLGGYGGGLGYPVGGVGYGVPQVGGIGYPGGNIIGH